MRLAILTTDTLHHRYFIRRLVCELPGEVEIVLVVFETKAYPWKKNARRFVRSTFPDLWTGLVYNPYLQPKGFGAAVDAFEAPRFFPEGESSLPDELSVESVHSVNSEHAQQSLRDSGPDLMLIYGTGVVEPATYRIAKMAAINAHGGKLPGYRGLDTNLWAVYEGKPEDMTATLHEVDEGLDTGPIYLSRPIGPQPDLSLVSLRYHTAILCTDMYLELISQFVGGTPDPIPQGQAESRYFGPMPWILKKRTDRLLRRYATKENLR